MSKNIKPCQTIHLANVTKFCSYITFFLRTVLDTVPCWNNSSRSCALLDDNSLRCFGRNFDGQLGLGDTEDRGDEARYTMNAMKCFWMPDLLLHVKLLTLLDGR